MGKGNNHYYWSIDQNGKFGLITQDPTTSKYRIGLEKNDKQYFDSRGKYLGFVRIILKINSSPKEMPKIERVIYQFEEL